MKMPRVTPGHPRLWLAPTELGNFVRRSRGERRHWRDQILTVLDRVLADPDPRAVFRENRGEHANFHHPEFTLALGAAWRMTGESKYARTAEWVLEELDLWEDNRHDYDSFGVAAEAAAYLYDWFHDHWQKTGQAQRVAEFTAILARRAADNLLHRYILEDWHNYSLGLQAGILAAAIALGKDHPRIENGALLQLMSQWHFTGYRDTSMRLQDCQKFAPTIRCLEAGLHSNNGDGYACLQESAGSYHAIDTWEVLKMAELWTHGTTAGHAAGGRVWPELACAGTALINTFRPDGLTVAFGDGGPRRPWYFHGRIWAVLNHRSPDPVLAWASRHCAPDIQERLPIYPLLYGLPELATVKAPPDSAATGPLVAMRSGWQRDATMLTFRCGQHGGWHNHLDHNSFTIFRGGPLAIDSGGGHYQYEHRPNYASRTIAHNAILVRNPKEKYWVGRYSQPTVNDGGQRLVTLSYSPPNPSTGGPHAPLTADRQSKLADEFGMGQLVAFDTTASLDYAAGDATAAYTYPWSGTGANPCRRVEESIRQILFLKPDLFVIFDRVESTQPQFIKTWLLHSIGVPTWQTRGRRRKSAPGITDCPTQGPLEIEHARGRLTVWPLLPQGQKIRVIGGKGFEGWVEGAPGSDAFGGRNFPPVHGGNESGMWRIEISPAQPAKRDVFLNVLHAGRIRDARAINHYLFETENSGEYTTLTIRKQSRSGPPVIVQFGNAGAIEAKVSGNPAGAYRNSAPAPARIKRVQ